MNSPSTSRSRSREADAFRRPRKRYRRAEEGRPGRQNHTRSLANNYKRQQESRLFHGRPKSLNSWRKAAKLTRPQEQLLWCEACERGFEDTESFSAHHLSRSHKKKQEQWEEQQEDEGPEIDEQLLEYTETAKDEISRLREQYMTDGTFTALPEDFKRYLQRSMSAKVPVEKRNVVHKEVFTELVEAQKQGKLHITNWDAKPPATGLYYSDGKEFDITYPQLKREEADASLQQRHRGRSERRAQRWVPKQESVISSNQMVPPGDGQTSAAPITQRNTARMKSSCSLPQTSPGRRIRLSCDLMNWDESMLTCTDVSLLQNSSKKRPLITGSIIAKAKARAGSILCNRNGLGEAIKPSSEELFAMMRDAVKGFAKRVLRYEEAVMQLDKTLQHILTHYSHNCNLCIDLLERYIDLAMRGRRLEDTGEPLELLMDLYETPLGRSRLWRDHFEACWVYHIMRTSKRKRDLHLALRRLQCNGPQVKLALTALAEVVNCQYEDLFLRIRSSSYTPEQRIPLYVRLSLKALVVPLRKRAIERLVYGFIPNQGLTAEFLSCKIGFPREDANSEVAEEKHKSLRSVLANMGLMMEGTDAGWGNSWLDLQKARNHFAFNREQAFAGDIGDPGIFQ